MIVLVTGGRDYRDTSHVWRVLDKIHEHHPIDLLVHGAAAGADTLAEQWAKVAQVDYRGCPAKWKQSGRAAGPLRNERMLTVAPIDLVVAFPGGRGTENMVERARAAGLIIDDHRKDRS